MIAASLPTSASAAALGLLYLAVGGVVALWLARAGHPPALAVSALAVWPLLLTTGRDDPPRPPDGPYADRIERTFASLRAVLSDPAATDLPWADDLGGLQACLREADGRLALVDRVLAEAGEGAGPLRAARHAAGREIEAVLDEVLQLRVQIGLVALAGRAAPVRDRLRELVARARALHEVSADPPDVALRYRRSREG